MDDSRFHKTTIVSKLFRQHSFNFDYLPPYGPELNPIEEIFSCLKSRYNSKRPRP
ncbi:hypothetical protein MXB_2336, partial [Myxobolus squamalis]